MRKSTLIIAGALALASTLAAQPGGGRLGKGREAAPRQQAFDLTKQFVLEGPVAAIHISYGAQYPSVEINGKLVKLAPVWFLLENDFEIKAGDVLRVVVAPGILPGDAYAYALSLANVKTQAAITLRDAQGVPEWTGGRGDGARRTALNRAACLDPASTITIVGTVEKVTAGAGIEMPALLIKAGTDFVTVRIGPEPILLEKDFELAPGDQVTVVAARSSCCDGYVALRITNAAGVTVVLRNEDGTPAW